VLESAAAPAAALDLGGIPSARIFALDEPAAAAVRGAAAARR
jgi:hypothetical protein